MIAGVTFTRAPSALQAASHGAEAVPDSAGGKNCGAAVYGPKRMQLGWPSTGAAELVTRCGRTRAEFSRPVFCASSRHLGCLLNRQKSRFGMKRDSRRYSYRRLVKVYASVEEEVKNSESGSSEDIRSPPSASDPQTSESTTSSPANPFAGGKISSRIAAKKLNQSQQPPSATAARKAPPKRSAVASNAPAAGQLSANAASQLKVAKSPSVFTVPTKPADGKTLTPLVEKSPSKPISPVPQPGASKLVSPPNPFRKSPFVPDDWEKAGARKPGSGKKVLEAFKAGESDGSTPKFGQKLAPENIFDEVRRTPEEIAADKFKFEISPGQLVLITSFLIIIGVMFGTVLLVWKLGGIHYNEY